MAASVDIISQSVFSEKALLLVAAIVGFVGSLLRQPLIVSFVAVGLLAGPSFLDIARSSEQIELDLTAFSEPGDLRDFPWTEGVEDRETHIHA